MNKSCRICGNAVNNTFYIAREMMFGLRDEFDYFQCSNCECLQAAELPADLDKYYPNNYYSFSEASISKKNRLKWFLKRQRMRYYLSGKGIIGSIMLKLYGDPDLPNWVNFFEPNMDLKILDVGCGTGEMLSKLQNEGYRNLTGFDPYFKGDGNYENGVRIHKRDLSEPSELFDIHNVTPFL